LKRKEGILQDGNAAMSKRTTIRLKLQPAWGVLARVLVAVSVSGSAVQAQTTPPGNIQATAASLDAPAGIAYDTAGNLYIADLNHNVIREVTVAGIITTIAGTGEQGFAGDDGAAISALLDSPAGVAVDAAMAARQP
jgi:DNA-binding beta-propeller fold protein YncE